MTGQGTHPEPRPCPVLVFPRSLLPAVPFLPWTEAPRWIRSLLPALTWEERNVAEQSGELVQVVASAVLRSAGHVFVAQRVANRRKDMDQKVSLVLGGHVEFADIKQPVTNEQELQAALDQVIRRELAEELTLSRLDALLPVGVVVDHRSTRSSRHAGFVFAGETSAVPRVRAPEEFLDHSLIGGRFFEPEQLLRVSTQLDPWSLVLLTQYLFEGRSTTRTGGAAP